MLSIREICHAQITCVMVYLDDTKDRSKHIEMVKKEFDSKYNDMLSDQQALAIATNLCFIHKTLPK